MELFDTFHRIRIDSQDNNIGHRYSWSTRLYTGGEVKQLTQVLVITPGR